MMEDIIKQAMAGILQNAGSGFNAKNVLKFAWVMAKKKIASDITQEFFKKGVDILQINKDQFYNDMVRIIGGYENYFIAVMEEVKEEVKKEKK